MVNKHVLSWSSQSMGGTDRLFLFDYLMNNHKLIRALRKKYTGQNYENT